MSGSWISNYKWYTIPKRPMRTHSGRIAVDERITCKSNKFSADIQVRNMSEERFWFRRPTRPDRYKHRRAERSFIRLMKEADCANQCATL